MQKSIHSTVIDQEIVERLQIAWEQVNVDTRERLYVLQRVHGLHTDVDMLRERIEADLERAREVLRATTHSANSFQQAKEHWNLLKVGCGRVRLSLDVTSMFAENRSRSTAECRA